MIGRGEWCVVFDVRGRELEHAGRASGEDEVDLFGSSVGVAGGGVAVDVDEAGVLEYANGAGAGFGVHVAADDLERGWREAFEDLTGLAFAVGFAARIPLQVGVGDDEGLGDFDCLGDVALFEFDAVMGWLRQTSEKCRAAVWLAVGFHLQVAGVAEGLEYGRDGFERLAFDLLEAEDVRLQFGGAAGEGGDAPGGGEMGGIDVG